MSVSTSHVFSQGPMLRTLGATALSALLGTHEKGSGGALLDRPAITRILPPRPEALVRDYIRHVGGDPAAYKGVLPPHMFPQWAFPLAAETLRGIPYPIVNVMNGGCRLEVNGRIPSNERLCVSARLVDINDDGRRAILHQRTTTGTEKNPEAIVAHLYAYVPLARNGQNRVNKPGGVASKPKPNVPTDAKEIAFLRIGKNAGLEFAKLTGDFNPIHWIPAYAHAMGFRATILHGFSTMARAFEALARGRLSGAVSRITTFDARFTRPVTLPARVGIYLAGEGKLFVGDAPGGGVYLDASYSVV
jgi:hypothetical protein